MSVQFKVAAVSDNRNAFGLKGVVLVAQTGLAVQVGSNDINLPQKGQILRVAGNPPGTPWPSSDLGTLDFSGFGFEIPERILDAPAQVIAQVWG